MGSARSAGRGMGIAAMGGEFTRFGAIGKLIVSACLSWPLKAFEPLLTIRHPHQCVEMIPHHAIGDQLDPTKRRQSPQNQHQALFLHLIKKHRPTASPRHQVKAGGRLSHARLLDAQPPPPKSTHVHIGIGAGLQGRNGIRQQCRRISRARNGNSCHGGRVYAVWSERQAYCLCLLFLSAG